MRYQAIADHQGQAPARWLCSALQVSARGYYAWRRRPESARRRRDRQLLVAFRASYERSRRVYGSPRVLLDLQDSGEACSRKRIARIMQGNGLVAVQRRRFRLTTQSGHDLPVQHGAPLRVVTPWKYGYKSAKSIVRFEFLERQPPTFWNDVAPGEYGFLSNVNPKIPHPRWSQASEKLIGTGERRPTLPYNGYREWVAGMYPKSTESHRS